MIFLSFLLAKINLELNGLLKLLPLPKFRWMNERATRLWKDWLVAGKQFMQRKAKWKKKRVNEFLERKLRIS